MLVGAGLGVNPEARFALAGWGKQKQGLRSAYPTCFVRGAPNARLSG